MADSLTAAPGWDGPSGTRKHARLHVCALADRLQCARAMTLFDRWLEPLAFVIAAAILLVKTC